jgi:hypothetical protein
MKLYRVLTWKGPCKGSTSAGFATRGDAARFAAALAERGEATAVEIEEYTIDEENADE